MGDFDLLEAALEGGGRVQFVCNDGPSSCAACQEHNGKTYDAASAPKPPLHPNCNCTVVPA